MPKSKQLAFKAETQKVLSILTHSLYTNREIFLRELLSNASDALEKLRFLQSKGEKLRDSELPLEIRISINKEEGILQIADTGVGMNETELIDNLGTIAKSGSEEFLQTFQATDTPDGPDKANAESPETSPKTADAEIIGRFGIGFYSVFMIAESVEVISVSALGEEAPHVWLSSGTGKFTVKTLEGEAAESYKRGTIVRAKVKDDAKEFLDPLRLQNIIRTHSNFLPFPIFVEDEQINTTPALWREPKFAITPEKYTEFYSYLTYDPKPPLEVIHLAVDAPVQFSALLFIPDSEQNHFQGNQEQWGLDLYVRRVLIEHSNTELIPQYFAFLKGVVDTEDLPLNISRETLQENRVIRKISQTIVKQVFKHLERMAESEKDKYQAFWKLHGRYVKFAFNDFANRDRVAPLMRFASSETSGGELISFDQYLERAKTGQKEIWHVSAPSIEAARVNPHMERFRQKGIEVLYLLDPTDEFVLESLGVYKECSFKSIEQAQSSDLTEFPDLDENPTVVALNDDEKNSLNKLMETMRTLLTDRITDIRISERLTGSPAVLVSPDGMSSSMEKLIRVMQKTDEIPKKILEINPDHSLIRALLRIFMNNPDNPLLKEFISLLFDNTLMMDGYINDPYLMADSNLKLMDKAVSWYVDLLKI